MYTWYDWSDGMLRERNGKLTMSKFEMTISCISVFVPKALCTRLLNLDFNSLC